MTNFDIESLVNFEPPKYLCYRCHGILYEAPQSLNKQNPRCPICGVEYIPTSGFKSWQVGRFLEEAGFAIDQKELFTHSRDLGRIAKRAREYFATLGTTKPRPLYFPIRALLEAINAARSFVHFTSFGISHLFVGALKLASLHVNIRGIVSGADKNIIDELTKYKDETPNLELYVFDEKSGSRDWNNTPHQKTIIIDGLLAFKGSANLTVSGWRKAQEGREVIELVTDIKEVGELNNRFFSPIWADSRKTDHVDMDALPF